MKDSLKATITLWLYHVATETSKRRQQVHINNEMVANLFHVKLSHSGQRGMLKESGVGGRVGSSLHC